MTEVFNTNSNFLFTATELVATSYNISNSNAQFKIISGKLPSGLTLSSTGVISGIPDPVLVDPTTLVDPNLWRMNDPTS